MNKTFIPTGKTRKLSLELDDIEYNYKVFNDSINENKEI